MTPTVVAPMRRRRVEVRASRRRSVWMPRTATRSSSPASQFTALANSVWLASSLTKALEAQSASAITTTRVRSILGPPDGIRCSPPGEILDRSAAPPNTTGPARSRGDEHPAAPVEEGADGVGLGLAQRRLRIEQRQDGALRRDLRVDGQVDLPGGGAVDADRLLGRGVAGRRRVLQRPFAVAGEGAHRLRVAAGE